MMQIILFSLLMSVIWSSVLVVFNYFCRKKHFFIRQLGIINLLFLYLFSVVRMLVPYKFTFTRVIPFRGVWHDIYRSASIDKIGETRISLLSVLFAVWMTVSAVLLIRFAIQYLRMVREVASCDVCRDEQCQRVFRRVLRKSGKQMKIVIRRSKYIRIPMGVGIFHKSIVLPEEGYSDSELYYILWHEYMHFCHRDLLVKVLIHIYGCIFWCNPVIHLLERDLAQVLEIKCDLAVTERMKYKDKAKYLATIVSMLRKAGARRQGEAFYGATALVSRRSEEEIVERFLIVSSGYGSRRRHLVFTASWFLVFSMLMFASYSFVIQPDDEMAMDGVATGGETSASLAEGYYIEPVDGTYYVYFPGQ